MIKTKRLILRPWLPSDFEPFSRLNADPRVMEFFPKLLTRSESDHLASSFAQFIESHNYGFWAVSVPSISDFIGFIGIQPVPFEAPFTPAIEIGWRLAHEHWGKGYATEGAIAALQYGFGILRLPSIVSFTAVQNLRSQRVMQRIGMTHDPKDDFNHPKLSSDHPLSRHVLYRKSNAEK